MFPIGIAATLLCYHQYAQGEWWMFFSCLHAYIVQAVCAVAIYGLSVKNVVINTSVSDYENNLSQLTKRATLFKACIVVGYIFMFCLDMFPFLASNQAFCWNHNLPQYEGGALVTLLTIAILVIWSSMLWSILKVNIKSGFTAEYDKMRSDKEKEARYIERKARETQNLKTKYGERLQIIDVVNDTIVISEENRCVRLNGRDYKFEDIMGCQTTYEESRETKTTSAGNSKTSTGNMVKRAVVGGVLTGGLGAVAGAATAKREISVESTSRVIVSRYYTVHVTINSLESPTINIVVGEDAPKARQISDIFNVIIARYSTCARS